MSLKTTLILALVAVLAWLGLQLVGEPEAPPPTQLPLVPDEVFAELESIECKLLSDQVLRLLRQPGGGFLLQFGRDLRGNKFFVEDLADHERVVGLLQALEQSYRQPLAGELSADDLLRLNLDPPKTRLMLKTPSKTLDIQFGADDPTGQGVMARIVGEPGGFRVGRQVPNQLEFNLSDFRDRVTFHLDPMTVDYLELVRFTKDGDTEILTAQSEGLRQWRISSPRSLKADTQKVRALVQSACALRIQQFVGQEFNDQLVEATGLPDEPRAILTLQAGGTPVVVKLGKPFSGKDLSAQLPFRNEKMCVSLPREEVEGLLQRCTIEQLRARRLYPPIENSAVSLRCADRDGRIRWLVERQSRHPRGKWEIQTPVESPVHAGLGAGSWPQVIVDLDRLEVLEFLDPGQPFRAEAKLTLEWKANQILQQVEIEVQRDGDQALARAQDQPGEVFAVPLKLWEISQLDAGLFRERVLLPGEKGFADTITGYRYEGGDVQVVIEKEPGLSAPRALLGSNEQSLRLQSGTSSLFGAEGLEILRPGAEDLKEWGLEEPQFQMTLSAGGSDHRFSVGGELMHQGRAAVYATLLPKFAGLVLVVDRARVQELIELRTRP